MNIELNAVCGRWPAARIKRLALHGATARLLLGASGWAAASCSLSFTSPSKGAKVTSPNITVFGSGGGDATTGDSGTVSATLNGSRAALPVLAEAPATS